ncbi:MAG: hypothetical protein FWF44_03270 [Defluviitaleaceae bacterium]|nr:hypothetical protein [Defluviitaleaceae bacterium]
MKIRPRAALLAAAAALALVAGCGSGGAKLQDQTAYEKIQTMLVNLTSFKADASVEYKSNKGSNTYDTLQQCRITGEYRIEVTGPKKVAGNVSIFDGKVISQFNTNISGRVNVTATENQERSEILLTNFIKNYLSSQEVSISVANIASEQCTVLEAAIPGNHPYLATEKLWVDNTTLKPVQLVIYDQQSSERIIVTYKTFEYNIQLDDSLFKL